LKEFSDAEQAILEIGSRHPLRREQAVDIEKEFSKTGVIQHMLKNRKLISIKYKNKEYLIPGRFQMGR